MSARLSDEVRVIAEDLWRVEKERAQAIGCAGYEDRYEDELSGYREICEAQASRVAALVAAAVAAERDRWDTEHAARTSEHIDLHAVKQIIDVTGCDGERGVAAWHALQPLIGHIEREAIVNARAAEREAHRATIQAVRDLHPKIENPRHGCCSPPKLCDGHPPECGGIDHGINRPNWPCATLRALIAEARSCMSPVETLLAEVLAAHSQVSGGAMRYCVCGAAYCDNTTNSRKVRKAWCAHVAAEQAKALRGRAVVEAGGAR